MTIYTRPCKKCGEFHDMTNCPFCNLKKIKIALERTANEEETEERLKREMEDVSIKFTSYFALKEKNERIMKEIKESLKNA